MCFYIKKINRYNIWWAQTSELFNPIWISLQLMTNYFSVNVDDIFASFCIIHFQFRLSQFRHLCSENFTCRTEFQFDGNVKTKDQFHDEIPLRLFQSNLLLIFSIAFIVSLVGRVNWSEWAKEVINTIKVKCFDWIKNIFSSFDSFMLHILICSYLVLCSDKSGCFSSRKYTFSW